jgi:hypothetical protein
MMMIIESQTEPPSCYEDRRESEQEVMMMMESQTEPPSCYAGRRESEQEVMMMIRRVRQSLRYVMQVGESQSRRS